MQNPKRAYRSPLRQEQAAQTRERIFAAAMAYLETHDIESLTLRQVAQLAGVSPPTVYAHFPTMDDLILAFFHWMKEGLGLDQPLPSLAELPSVPARRFPLYERHARLLFNLMNRPSWDRARTNDSAQRHGVWLDGLRAEIPEASEAGLRLGGRAIFAFWSPTLWRWMKETCGFTPEECERVARWAVTTLAEALKRDPAALDAPSPPSPSPSSSDERTLR
jgi:AcrR family transcriptional regulator